MNDIAVLGLGHMGAATAARPAARDFRDGPEPDPGPGGARRRRGLDLAIGSQAAAGTRRPIAEAARAVPALGVPTQDLASLVRRA